MTGGKAGRGPDAIKMGICMIMVGMLVARGLCEDGRGQKGPGAKACEKGREESTSGMVEMGISISSSSTDTSSM